MNKCWKDAASIIIAGRSSVFSSGKQIRDVNGKYNTPNFKILVLKRGKSSPFFPGGYVFPGGVVEESDGCHEWLNLYDSYGFKHDLVNLASLTPKIPLYSKKEMPLHASVSLRITAIRETFEESGILLCRCKKGSSSISSWASFVAGQQLQQWQRIVQTNANDFLNLCKELKCVPDIWALHQWSNWLTPTNNPIRFDTAFFLTTIDQLPPSYINDLEMEDIKWLSPIELLQGNPDSVWLPPPQYYEISRIMKHQSIEHLNDYAIQRSTTYGSERWMPIQKKAEDGIICLLPGDDLYPEHVDYDNKDKMEIIENTMEHSRKNVHKVHRMELLKDKGIRIFMSNIEPNFGHVSPADL